MNRKGLKILREVHRVFRDRKITLSLAESCTGGLISHYITLLPGASTFFEAGAVTYSANAKRKILGIPKETLLVNGIVSEQTAQVMAERVRYLLGTDYALSTTGNLGPDVLEGGRAGLIYMAVSSRKGTDINKVMLTGKRKDIKDRAALIALEFLLKKVKKRNQAG